MSKLVVTASALNLRNNPSIDGGVIEILEKGDVVESVELSFDNYWQKVRSSSSTGWASLKYLQPYLPHDAPVAGFAWFDIAMRELNKGVVEYPGSFSNPRIVEYLRSTNLGSSMATTDETPWCSAFVNFCVELAGFAGTDSAMARSWLSWGREIQKPIVGCIVVFKRGEPPHGHVAFYISEDENSIKVLGGNQGNRVSIDDYKKDRLLGFRVPRWFMQERIIFWFLRLF